MATQKLIKKIIDQSELIIKNEKEGLIRGYIINAETKKRESFRISWYGDHVYLNINKDNDRLLNIFFTGLGKAQLRAECGKWFGISIMYSWVPDEKELTKMHQMLSYAAGTNTGLFSFLGWQKVELLT